VITGAGRGIGQGIAQRCGQEGMKVVLAGIGMESLTRTAIDLEARGVQVLVVQTDVSKFADIQTLAQRTLDAFGGIHLLVNNAGVDAGTTAWESSLADWEWMFGVNLWGVIYAIKVFIPIMLNQLTECHIVNVASFAGLIDGPGHAIYKVTKQGIISLSETLYHDLASRQSRVGVSVLCPGFVKTDILSSERNRPPELQNAPDEVIMSLEIEAFRLFLKQGLESGIPVEQIADALIAAIRNNQLYVLTHPQGIDVVKARTENIVLQRNPLTRPWS
jgi:NAD(P)-dependent dehydrogenase (short-subunit alcohol dehydrogenase family)